jgi:hypothetical protein
MSSTHCVGDHVILQGTRIAGDVARIESDSDHPRVSVRVTAVLGKSPTSKTARAWQGAWVTCMPAMVIPAPR